MRISTIAAAAGLTLLAGAVQAKPISESEVAGAKVQFDPQMGYIYVHSPYRWFATFLRVPDDETRAKYQEDWEKAFAKAQKRYPSQLANWQSRYDLAVRTKGKLPEKPPEPDRETFSIDPIELRDTVAVGPMFAYTKGEQSFGYLTSVKPGTYIYYGPVMLAVDYTATGLCLCMGTVKFEVRPGVVTDLGNYLHAAPEQAKNWDVGSMVAWRRVDEKAAKSGKPLDPGIMVRGDVAFGLPPSLSAWPTERAQFHASGKMNNYYGVGVSRLTPIPGVLAYRRDNVIDARNGEDVPSPPIVTQVKIKK